MTKAKKVKEIVLCMIFVAIILSVMAETSAATIQGKVYGPDLELAKKAVLEINSTPRQNLVSTDGTYSFVVLQGTYKIEAFYAIQGKLLYTN